MRGALLLLCGMCLKVLHLQIQLTPHSTQTVGPHQHLHVSRFPLAPFVAANVAAVWRFVCVDGRERHKKKLAALSHPWPSKKHHQPKTLQSGSVCHLEESLAEWAMGLCFS